MFRRLCQTTPRAAPIPACLACMAAALTAVAAPRIVVPQTTYAFGWRDAAETVTNRFVLRNGGDAPLLLTDIHVSCGCAHAEPERRALQPGEETTLEVRMSLRGLHGALRKAVTVVSNDPDTPYLNLWVAGEARAAVCLEPQNVSFGRVNPREPPEPVTVQLAGYLTNLTVAAASSDTSDFAVAVTTNSRSITVLPPKLASPGAHHGHVRVTLSDPSQPALDLHLYAWLDDALRIVPSALVFRPGTEPASTRLVVVRPGTATGFRITEARVEGGKGEAKALVRPDGSYQVAVERVIPDSLSTNAALVVRTNIPKRTDWRVPLRREGGAAPAP